MKFLKIKIFLVRPQSDPPLTTRQSLL